MRKLMIEMTYRNYTSSKVMKTAWKPETIMRRLLNENKEYIGAIFTISDIETGKKLAKATVTRAA